MDVTGLLAIEGRGYCWSVGNTRIGERECRIFPRRFEYKWPIIIKLGDSFAEAIDAALTELGDKKPQRKPPATK